MIAQLKQTNDLFFAIKVIKIMKNILFISLLFQQQPQQQQKFIKLIRNKLLRFYLFSFYLYN